MRLADKHVEETFPVTPHCNVTVVVIENDSNEYGEPVQKSQLLATNFVVHCHVENHGEHSEIALPFNFRQPPRPVDISRDVALAVDFIDLVDQQQPLVSFLLTLHPHSFRGLSNKGSESSSEESEEEEGGQDILLMGVKHDNTEMTMVLNLPPLLNRLRMYDGAQNTQDVLVFWEPQTKAHLNEVFLLPRERLFPHMFTLRLEGSVVSSLQFAISAHILYSTKDAEMRDTVFAWHGQTREDQVMAMERYGDEGNEINLVGMWMHETLQACMNMGQQRTLYSLLPLFHDTAWIDDLMADTALLYETVWLSAVSREKLREAREQVDGAQEWYYTRFFVNFLASEDTTEADNERVARNADKFRHLLFRLTERLMEDDSESVSHSQTTDEAVNSALAQLQVYGRDTGWLIDEHYFAELTRIVFSQFGNLNRTLKQLIGDGRRWLEVADAITFYRDMQSLIHVKFVMQTTRIKKALVVVGTGHIDNLYQLFLTTSGVGDWVSQMRTRRFVPGLLPDLAGDETWLDLLQAFLAFEEIDAWLTRPPDETGLWRPRMQLFFYLDLARLLPNAAPVQQYRILRLFYTLFMTYWPYDRGNRRGERLPAQWDQSLLEQAGRYTREASLPHVLYVTLRVFDEFPIAETPREPARLPSSTMMRMVNEINGRIGPKALLAFPASSSKFFLTYDEAQRTGDKSQRQEDGVEGEPPRKKEKVTL